MEEGKIAVEILKFLATELPGEFNINIMSRMKEISKWTGIPYLELRQFLEKIFEEGTEKRRRIMEEYLKYLITQ